MGLTKPIEQNLYSYQGTFMYLKNIIRGVDYMKNKIAIIAVIIIVVSILASWLLKQQRNLISQDQNQTMAKEDLIKAPDFSLYDTKGELHQLADYEGEKVYIKYWASWCPICLAGLEEINNLSQEDNDFKVLTIVTPGYKGEKDSESFIEWFKDVKEGDHMTVLLDEDGTIASKIGLRGYPTSIYINSEGDIEQILPGHVNNDMILQTFESIQ